MALTIWLTVWLTPPPPWAAYCTLMAYRLVQINKRPGVCTMGVGETLHHYLSKIFIREAGYQTNMTCENLQLCTGLEAGIEGSTYDVGQRRRERNKRGREE